MFIYEVNYYSWFCQSLKGPKTVYARNYQNSPLRKKFLQNTTSKMEILAKKVSGVLKPSKKAWKVHEHVQPNL